MAQAARTPVRWAPVAVGLPLATAALLLAELTKSGPGDPRLLAAGALLGLCIVCLIWIVPASWSISASLALTMFGGQWRTLGLPNLVAPNRLVLGIALLAVACRAPAASNRPPIHARGVYALMYVAGAYALGSAINDGTIAHHNGIFDLLDRMQLFAWLVFIIAPAAFTTASDRRVLLGTMVGMGIYLGFTSIFEILGPHALVFPRYILNPHVGIHFGRARGPFVEAAVNGLALYSCILAALIARREWRGHVPRALAIVAIVVCVPSLLLTFQRAIWVAVVVAAPLTLLAVRELRRFLVPVVLAGALLTGLAFTIPSVHRKLVSRAGSVTTFQNRNALDAAAIAMVEARPVLGFGWDSFTTASQNYFQTSDSYSNITLHHVPAHDLYLSIAAELGLAGLFLWGAVLLIGVGGAVLTPRAPPEMRPWRIALGSLLIMWLVVGITSPLYSEFQSLIIWLWAAVIMGSTLERDRPVPGLEPVAHLEPASA